MSVLTFEHVCCFLSISVFKLSVLLMTLIVLDYTLAKCKMKIMKKIHKKGLILLNEFKNGNDNKEVCSYVLGSK